MVSFRLVVLGLGLLAPLIAAQEGTVGGVTGNGAHTGQGQPAVTPNGGGAMPPAEGPDPTDGPSNPAGAGNNTRASPPGGGSPSSTPSTPTSLTTSPTSINSLRPTNNRTTTTDRKEEGKLAPDAAKNTTKSNAQSPENSSPSDGQGNTAATNTVSSTATPTSSSTASAKDSGDIPASEIALAATGLKEMALEYLLDAGSPLFPFHWVPAKDDGSGSPGVDDEEAGLGNTRSYHPIEGREPPPAPQSLFWHGTAITVKGNVNHEAGGAGTYTIDGDEKPVNVSGDSDTLVSELDLQDRDHKLSFSSPAPQVTEVIIKLVVLVSTQLNEPDQVCETTSFVNGDKVTASNGIKFEGETSVNDGAVVLSSGSSVAVTLRDNSTLLYLRGQVDPSFGAYEAYIASHQTGDTSTGNVAGNAKRSEKAKEALYFVRAMNPEHAWEEMVLNATDTVALEAIEVCYSTTEIPAAKTTGSKPPIGAIVGGVIGGLVALAFGGFLYYYFRRPRAPRADPRYSSVTVFTGGTALEAGTDTPEKRAPVARASGSAAGPSATSSMAADSSLPSACSGAPLLAAQAKPHAESSRTRASSSHLQSPTRSISDSHSLIHARRHSKAPQRAKTTRIQIQGDHNTGPALDPGDGDALPTYNNEWKSTANVKEKPALRGFIPRRASQASMATTISTIDGED